MEKEDRVKREVLFNEGIYYKNNRCIIKEGNKYFLRNTWTGEEKEITEKEVEFYFDAWR